MKKVPPKVPTSMSEDRAKKIQSPLSDWIF